MPHRETGGTAGQLPDQTNRRIASEGTPLAISVDARAAGPLRRSRALPGNALLSRLCLDSTEMRFGTQSPQAEPAWHIVPRQSLGTRPYDACPAAGFALFF